mgnify:CR=1 FL=1
MISAGKMPLKGWQGIIGALYRIQIPKQGKTTFNVGQIQGGTLVNTIAQEAHMLYEFRSDRREHLDYMQDQFDKVIEQARAQGWRSKRRF